MTRCNECNDDWEDEYLSVLELHGDVDTWGTEKIKLCPKCRSKVFEKYFQIKGD